MIDLKKFQTDFDVYSDPLSAKSKSNSMGLGGAIHVYDLNGQAYYMPGANHKEYLNSKQLEYGQEPLDEAVEGITEDRMVEALRAVVAEIMNKSDRDTFKVLKVDEEQRIIFGWASVTKYQGEYVVDLQNEIIRTETLHKAVNDFMKGVRVGKVLHDGEQTGTIIHSFPISKEICEALGIQSDKEGWITGYYVEDDDLWKAVKAGDYREFSIGGNADAREFDAN